MKRNKSEDDAPSFLVCLVRCENRKKWNSYLFSELSKRRGPSINAAVIMAFQQMHCSPFMTDGSEEKFESENIISWRTSNYYLCRACVTIKGGWFWSRAKVRHSDSLGWFKLTRETSICPHIIYLLSFFSYSSSFSSSSSSSWTSSHFLLSHLPSLLLYTLFCFLLFFPVLLFLFSVFSLLSSSLPNPLTISIPRALSV